MMGHVSVSSTPKRSLCAQLITAGQDAQPRITFTVPVINHARCVMFVVAGAQTTSLSPDFAPADDLTYPSRLIQPQGELWWLLDQTAGQDLKLGIIIKT